MMPGRCAGWVSRLRRVFGWVPLLTLLGVMLGCSRHDQTASGGRGNGSVTAVAQRLEPNSWPAQAIIATNSIELQERLEVSGDIAVTRASPGPWLSSNAEFVADMDAVVTGNLQADTVVLNARSRITGSASYNQIAGSGTVDGTRTTPLGLPIPISIPDLPTISTGVQDVSVPASQTQTLSAGTYRAIKLESGNGGVITKLILSGGVYQMSSLELGNDASLICSAACDMRTTGRLSVGARSVLGPASVPGLGPGNVQVFVQGSNAGGQPTSTPSAAYVDCDSVLKAYLLAPNGTARFAARAQFVGKLVAKDVLFSLDGDATGVQLPIITQQPASLTVAQGQSAQFGVVATGTGLTYQWQRGGTKITGATAAQYTLASAAAADSGATFRVVVTNAAGSVTSSTATLTVNTCAATDTTCDGIDDDCDGSIDEDYVVSCSGSSVLRCVNGAARPAVCSDNNACNGIESCSAGMCVAGTPPVVDDGNPCTADSCSPATGVAHVPVPAGTSCADGNVCNGAETCNCLGACVAGTPLAVNDGNPCTADSCNPTTGVTHTPVAAGTSCPDGNLCNGSEICNGSGTCVAGTPPVVDDGNPCTVDSCNPTTGVAHRSVAAGTPCADGNLCNGAEVCNCRGVCVAGTPPVVDDGNPCTADSCNPATGVAHALVAAGTSCADGNPCNGAETCNGSGVCVAGTPPRLVACSGEQQVAVSISVPEGLELSRVPLAASNELRVNSGVEIVLSDPSRGATLTNAGTYTFIGAGAKVPSLRVAATLSLQGGAEVQGFAWAGGVLDKADTANIADGYREQVPVVFETIAWDRPFGVTTEGVLLGSHTTRAALAPGRYRTISLGSYAQLELESGTYELDQLLLEPGSELAMPGPTRIWVRSELSYQGNMIAHPESFYLVYLGDSDVSIEGNLSGTLLAPYAKVSLASLTSGSHRGSVIAESIEVLQNAHFEHVAYTGRGHLAYKAPSQSDLDLATSTGFFSLRTAWWSGSIATVDQALEEQTCPAEFSDWTTDAEPQPDFQSLPDKMLVPDRPPGVTTDGTYDEPHVTTHDNPELSGVLELEDGQTIPESECGLDGVCHEFGDMRYDCETRLDFHSSMYASCDVDSCFYWDWNQGLDFIVKIVDARVANENASAARQVPWELRSGRLNQGQTLFAYGFKDLGTNNPFWYPDPVLYRDTPNLWTKLDPEVLVVPVVVVGVYLPWRDQDRYEVGMANYFHGWRLIDYDNKYYEFRDPDDWDLPYDSHALWDMTHYDVVHPDDVYDKCKVQFQVVAAFEMEGDLNEYNRCITNRNDETCQPLGPKEKVFERFREVYGDVGDQMMAIQPVYLLYGELREEGSIGAPYAGKTDVPRAMVSIDPNVRGFEIVTAHEFTHVFGGNHLLGSDRTNLFDAQPNKDATLTDEQCGFSVEQDGVVGPETGIRAAARGFAVRYSQYQYNYGQVATVVPPSPPYEHRNPCCIMSDYEQRNVSPATCLQAGGTSDERLCDGQRYCCSQQGQAPIYAATCDSSQRVPLSDCALEWQCCRTTEREQFWLPSSDCSAQGGSILCQTSETEQLWLASADCLARSGSVVSAAPCREFSYCCENAAGDRVTGSFESCSTTSHPLSDCDSVCCADGTTVERAERFNCLAEPGNDPVTDDQCEPVCCDWTDPARANSEDRLYNCVRAGSKVGDAGDPLCHPST
jgi:hypothetical protein